VFVFFGGTRYKEEGTAPLFNDTWIFDPSAKEWRQGRPAVSPPARAYHRLTWCDKLGALLVAGGVTRVEFSNPTEPSMDLWVYETAADRWTEVKTATAPPPGGAATCYDAAQDLVVLFNSKGQTWVCKIEREEAKK